MTTQSVLPVCSVFACCNEKSLLIFPWQAGKLPLYTKRKVKSLLGQEASEVFFDIFMQRASKSQGEPLQVTSSIKMSIIIYISNSQRRGLMQCLTASQPQRPYQAKTQLNKSQANALSTETGRMEISTGMDRQDRSIVRLASAPGAKGKD